MNIDPIQNGVVIDHIPAGKAMALYQHLNLEQADCSVAILKNVPSQRLGRKDIIKIDDGMDIDWDVLGYIAPDCTINVIRDGVISEKRHLALPEKLVNVIRCRNPRCITTIEQELPHIFYLADEKTETYRCMYCEEKYGKSK